MSAEINQGTLIHNRYLIQKTLAKGGFGRTYLALDSQRFNEACVLKEFFPDSKNSNVISKCKELFEREAKVLYQIKHQQIPQFLALLTQNEQLFIVQEYIDGKTYLQILDERLSRTGKPFSEMEVREWLLNMLPVLEYIHSCNIIHRDISLENVMLPNNQSKPVLIDFGVVKEKFTHIFESYSSLQQNLRQASVVGKIGYSPPEQLRLGHCFPCSDIYALAVCAVILLTGKMPHLLVDKSLKWDCKSNINISQSLASIFDQMLAQAPKDRYQSAKEVLIELNNNQNYNKNVNYRVKNNGLKQKVSLGGILSTILSKITHQNEKQNADNGNTFEQLEQTLVYQNPEFVDYCQRQLTSFVGPLASFVVEQTLEENPDIVSKEFVEVLAQKIPDAQRAKDFRSQVKLLEEFKPEKTLTLNQAPSTLINSPAISNPDFLDYCQRELTTCIGPFASVVIKDILDENPHFTPKQLVETLVAEIPNQQRAKEFEKRILDD